MALFHIFFTALIAQCLCTMYHTYSIGNGLTPIKLFSAGEAHITIGYGPSASFNITKIERYDTPTNTTTIITNTINTPISFLRELKGTNTPMSNIYIFEKSTSLNYMANNLATVAYQKAISIGESAHSCFGATTSEVYYCINSASGISVI
jgi:hypothetical protein